MAAMSNVFRWKVFLEDACIKYEFISDYADMFDTNRIEADMLEELTKDILKDIGIQAIGDILLILRHAKKVCILNVRLRSIFRFNIPDPNRPWGGECSQCQGTCTGHFLTQNQNLKYYQKHGREGMMFRPPSRIISEAHKKFVKNKVTPSKKTITDLAKQTLLSTDDVTMWLEHLDEVRKNRVEGAKQAAATRKAKSSKKVVQEKQVAVQEEGDEEVPDAYCLCGEGEVGLMIACDAKNCPVVWYHANCVGLTEETIPDGLWYCQLCKT